MARHGVFTGETMKEIPLTRGKLAIVDDEDYERLSSCKWYIGVGWHTYYAVGKFNGKKILMHRVITNCPDGLEVDHIDGNGLNNQKSNLRVTTTRGNAQNRHQKTSSKYPGVDYTQGHYRARIRVSGKLIELGNFCMEELAYARYLHAVGNVERYARIFTIEPAPTEVS